MRRERTSSGGYGTLALAPVIVAATVVVSGWATAQEPPPPPVPVPFSGQGQATDQGEGEVLTRGPVHEAFAGPVVFNPSAGPVVPKAPPGRVEELPPDQKPEGDDVDWIPGYWQWDDDRQDFLWISGIWRVMPPGRQWIPGYWNAVQGGYQWISGYWGPTEQQSVEYLPPPPSTLEVGPNVPAPGAQGYVWAPGYWQWIGPRYVWRPGVWVQAYPEWIWVPPSYVYTPSGCVFIPGYWDYALARRGLLFAPVYFPAPVYAQPAFVYTPTVNINITLLTNHFFARPACHHYYFGDYYASSYSSAGYVPWFNLSSSPVGYDPIYAWSAATYTRQDVTWVTRVHETYRYRVEHVEARPARTFVAQQRLLEQRQDSGARDLVLARTLAQTAAAENHRFRLERIDQAHRAEFARREQRLSEYRELRARREAEVHVQHHPQGNNAARRMDLPRSPLVATAPSAAVARERRQEALHDLQERRQQAGAEAGQRQAAQREQHQQERRQLLEERRQQEQAADATRQRRAAGHLEEQRRQAEGKVARHPHALQQPLPREAPGGEANLPGAAPAEHPRQRQHAEAVQQKQALEQQRVQQAEARRHEQREQLHQQQAAAEQARRQHAEAVQQNQALEQQRLQQAEARRQDQREQQRQQQAAVEQARRQQAASQQEEHRRRQEQALQQQQALVQQQHQQREIQRQQAQAAENARRQQAAQGQPHPEADPQKRQKAKRGGPPR